MKGTLCEKWSAVAEHWPILLVRDSLADVCMRSFGYIWVTSQFQETSMRQIIIAILGLGPFCCFTQMTIDKTSTRKMELTCNGPEKYGTFKLYYSYSALGSGMGSMQPTFRVNGANYVYTREQNSYYGKPNKKPENICKGRLRNSSIDSILNIVKGIKDSLVYKTNTGIMSGDVHNISVVHEKTK
jgi:hypothetical protein